MKSINQIAIETYGKDYDSLPDDGVEQDNVQGLFSAQKFTAGKVRDIIAQDWESDLPDRVIDALRPFDGKNISTRILSGLPALPNGATWRLVRHYGWTCLQTSSYGTMQGYADKTSLDLILARSEKSVPLDLNYVAGKIPLSGTLGENCAYFSARVERNADRLTAMNDGELCKRTAEALNRYAEAIAALESARAGLDALTEYVEPLHPMKYDLRRLVDPHDKAGHVETK
jgi:hypothetical protein